MRGAMRGAYAGVPKAGRWWLAGGMAGLWLSGALCGALASPQGTEPAHDQSVVVGIPVVPAETAPGAKVRTPVRMEALAGAAVAGPAHLSPVSAADAAVQLQTKALDAWIGVLPGDQALPSSIRATPLRWSASPMAIMRTDTDIHGWKALRGRTVCLVRDGRYVGELAARFDAREQLYPSSTDALLALRTGQCDLTVQDEAFLRQLLKFPEWKKFSASLTPYRYANLVRLTPRDQSREKEAALRKATEPASLQALAEQQARDIAFEVYLDQDVPDCH